MMILLKTLLHFYLLTVITCCSCLASSYLASATSTQRELPEPLSVVAAAEGLSAQLELGGHADAPAGLGASAAAAAAEASPRHTASDTQRQGASTKLNEQEGEEQVEEQHHFKLENLNKHDNVHKLMNELDLRRTFQVDKHDQVPEYEVLRLTKTSKLNNLINLEEEQAPAADEQGADGIVTMKLQTFGKDFKLRLKRNVDFQQRIKDMKMFMAETTKDGQLRYTEIKAAAAAAAAAASQQRQEPGKRAAAASEPQQQQTSATATSAAAASTTPKPSSTVSSQPAKDETAARAKLEDQIGFTFHDEENLAALLIAHDRRTGQLQVDGTIGNDFVIKPMPRAAVEAMLMKQQQLAKSTAGANELGDKSISKPLELDQQQSIAHMHDDDPHDDDEMFLDEDEAIELAHLRGLHVNTTTSSNNSNSTNSAIKLPQTTPPRTLSKAASERKWKKYRKLMAQTQVPKLNAIQDQRIGQRAPEGPAVAQADSKRADSSSSSGPRPDAGGRARRHAHHLEVSHHIVYRQRPSAEGSSEEHKHSFLMSPSQQRELDMEQLALSFSPARIKRSSLERGPAAADGDDSNMIDSAASKAAAAGQLADNENEADFAHDPLGGQFYLEPGSITGFERAGYSDWSLLSGSRLRAPYAQWNGTEPTRTTNSTSASSQHRRYKRQILTARRLPMNSQMSQVRRKRQAPDTVWPEVLLVVDYDSFLLHGGDSRDVKRYFVSFWNGVDLRYKLLVHPHIRISLAGMIVAKDRDATPYLERNRLRAPNADAVDAAGALTDMGKYLYREDRLPTYDLAVVITKLDMCRRRYEGGRCNRGTAGFAYVGGACVVNKRLEKVNSVAIIEDSGGFSGIIVAAHEVGHLLGCVHDGSPPPSYLGGPGATHCPWEDGFIMSDLRHTERGFRWSQCSVEQFKHFLNGETATCLYNYPHESQMLHRLLPGTMLSLDEQCKRDRGTNACFKDARVCAQLFCFDSASGYCVSYRPAAEGSPCGEAQVCKNGKCVSDLDNVIPDYTHQSQTIVSTAGTSVIVPQSRARQASPGRLADNGLSASSTSTATSSPDGKPTAAVTNQQISSRMDSAGPAFSSYDPLTSSSYSTRDFGGRYASAASSTTAGSRKQATASANGPGKVYLQRSGHQAITKGANAMNSHSSSSKQQPMYTSASTTSITHQQLAAAAASSSISPQANGKSNLLNSKQSNARSSSSSTKRFNQKDNNYNNKQFTSSRQSTIPINS